MALNHVRIIQWNISIQCNPFKIAEFLKNVVLSEFPTIVCLQEVQRNDFETLAQILEPASMRYSLDFRSPGTHEGKNRRMGVAIFTFNATISKAGLLDRTVFPERSLWARVETQEKEIQVTSFHSLTGVGYKKAKASNFAAIADHLQANTDLDFLCFDANEPRTDSLALENLEFWQTNGDKGRNAALIMGVNPVHRLSDSFRKYVTQTSPSEAITLPITHYTGQIGRRYDYVFSSPRWFVSNIEHPLEASLQASNDHAAVIVDVAEVVQTAGVCSTDW